MRTRKVQLECIDASVLAPLDDFNPGVAIVLFHDRRDQNAVRKLVFDLLKFIEPNFEWPVAYQFDVFPADWLFALGAEKLGVSRCNVDYFR